MLRRVIIGVLVAFAVQIAFILLAVCVYDPEAMKHRWQTVSANVWDLAGDSTFWAVLITAELCAPVFLLLGHLLLGQRIK